MATGTVKSLKAGSNFTLKKGISCPDYGEGFKHAFPGKGHLKPHEEELLKLKRRVTDLEEEREILKKALAIFSKHRK
jgi:hypothetical protein